MTCLWPCKDRMDREEGGEIDKRGEIAFFCNMMKIYFRMRYSEYLNWMISSRVADEILPRGG